MGAMQGSVLQSDEPGALFTAVHWKSLCLDLLSIVMEGFPSQNGLATNFGVEAWENKVKHETLVWAREHQEWCQVQQRKLRERGLAKLTYDEKIALGLPT